MAMKDHIHEADPFLPCQGRNASPHTAPHSSEGAVPGCVGLGNTQFSFGIAWLVDCLGSDLYWGEIPQYITLKGEGILEHPQRKWIFEG